MTEFTTFLTIFTIRILSKCIDNIGSFQSEHSHAYFKIKDFSVEKMVRGTVRNCRKNKYIRWELMKN